MSSELEADKLDRVRELTDRILDGETQATYRIKLLLDFQIERVR